ncbi:MAG: hypothetical protein KDD94_00970 [Calditrichaeota bacterium]|nr:hypothetical protein [Calditrichota bacterium]
MKLKLKLSLLGLILIIACQDQSASIDGIDLSELFERKIRNLSEVQITKSAIETELKEYVPLVSLSADQIRFFNAEVSSRNDEYSAVQIVIVNLQLEELGAAKLLLMLKNSDVLMLRLAGNKEIDEDRFAAYANFCRQFDRSIRIPDPSTILTETEIDSYIATMDLKTKYLFDHSRRMVNKDFLLRHTMAMTANGKTPPAEWYRQQQNEFQLLAFQIDQIEELIGKEAIVAYKSEANKVIEALNPVIEQLETAPDPAQLESRIVQIRNENRRSCHTIKTTKSDRGLKSYLESIGPENGHRRDLFRVDMDVWAMPGKDKLSQELASSIRATTIFIALAQQEN